MKTTYKIKSVHIKYMINILYANAKQTDFNAQYIYDDEYIKKAEYLKYYTGSHLVAVFFNAGQSHDSILKNIRTSHNCGFTFWQ